MEIKEYLDKYGRDEYRLMKWLKGYGINLLVAMNLLGKYADEEKVFETGVELDKSLLSESLKAEVDPFKEFIEAKEQIRTVTSDMLSIQQEFQKWWMEQKSLNLIRTPWYRRLKEWLVKWI